MKKVHGHDVMQMMIDSGKSYSKASLEAAVIAKFGSDARFHTCSADGMTASELIDLLEGKGKFTLSDDGFKTDPSRVCGH
jgi:probable metal-binding protein